MTDLPINQKEYLKKYLAIGKAPGEKRKKKKKSTNRIQNIQIIDDDAVISLPSNTVNQDPIVIDEDAPQIVAIIDERPPSMRVDEKTKNPLWQPIGSVNIDLTEQKPKITGFKIAPKAIDDKSFARPDKSPPRKKKQISDGDNSPPRNSRRESTPPLDIVIKQERKSEPRFEDSPPRRSKYGDDNPPQRKSRWEPNNDDASPPRRRQRRDSDISPPRRGRENNTDRSRSQSKYGDNSPPRRNKQTEDISPPRRKRHTDDISPLRKNKPTSDVSSPIKNRHSDDVSPPRRNRNNDISPPRRNRRAGDVSPPRRNRNNDISPPRRNRLDDVSPPRRNRRDISPPRRKREATVSIRTADNSPPRKHKKDDRITVEERKSKNLNEDKRSKKMEKTLDGKSAGLQNAQELIEETRNFKNREDKLFKNLATDVSGQNAETVHRDRRTGKIRNLEEEEERQRKKREEEEKSKEQYAKWGRGLAQVESRDQQIKEQLYEMSKPLARYADDEDLEKYLKEQEREGDPMLAYIRKKKKKKAVDAGEAIKPQFEGEFMPNRYGIRPGHRWDGVDRSIGYEKKWFEVQNEKKSLQEESYKWSTEDM